MGHATFERPKSAAILQQHKTTCDSSLVIFKT